jgi:hypothetical protein
VDAGIQGFHCVTKTLDTGFNRCDDFLQSRPGFEAFATLYDVVMFRKEAKTEEREGKGRTEDE